MSSKKYLPGPESYQEFRETGPRTRSKCIKIASSAGKNAASKPRLVFGFTPGWQMARAFLLTNHRAKWSKPNANANDFRHSDRKLFQTLLISFKLSRITIFAVLHQTIDVIVIINSTALTIRSQPSFVSKVADRLKDLRDSKNELKPKPKLWVSFDTQIVNAIYYRQWLHCVSNNCAYPWLL